MVNDKAIIVQNMTISSLKTSKAFFSALKIGG
jgi:hypothetical protein